MAAVLLTAGPTKRFGDFGSAPRLDLEQGAGDVLGSDFEGGGRYMSASI